MIDVEIHSDSPWCGKRLSELSLPEDIVVSSMVRHGKIMSPRGNTQIQDKDILFIMGTPERVLEAVSTGGAEIPSASEITDSGENPEEESADGKE